MLCKCKMAAMYKVEVLKSEGLYCVYAIAACRREL